MKQIPLSRGQTAIVCDCHYHLVKGYKWCADWDKHKHQFRALRAASVLERMAGASPNIYMHRVINGTPKGFETATQSENQHNRNKYATNTSGFKGVTWHKAANKWAAQIKVNGKHVHLGLFDAAEDAARAYNKAAQELHGEFANPNFK